NPSPADEAATAARFPVIPRSMTADRTLTTIERAGETMSSDLGEIDQRHLDAIADADQYCYWYEHADEPYSNPTLVRTERGDLCVIGGGYTGLWPAIVAKERDPSRDVVLIDAHECGSAASGRNGGFMDASLTHGVGNAMSR